MTQEKFRIMHSELIEHYQFIEMHLEAICAYLSDKSFMQGLEDVEKSNISHIVHEIKKHECEKSFSVLSAEDYDRIESMRLRRNFWCHDCYTKMVFDAKTWGPKKEKDRKALVDDTMEAQDLRAKLFQIQVNLLYPR